MQIEDVFSRFRQIKSSIKLKKRSSRLLFGEHKSKFKGFGFDILGVSEWEKGEPLRDIDWPLTLSTYPDRIWKVDWMEPRQIRVLLVADLSHSMLFQISNNANKALLMMELIGIFGLSHAHIIDPVGMLGFSDKVELFLKPKLGSRYVFYMAKAIFERVELERKLKERRKTDFSAMADFLSTRVRTRHSIIVISDFIEFMNDGSVVDPDLLRHLSSKHDILFVFLDDPGEFAAKGKLGYVRVSNIETGEQAVISLRKLKQINREIKERRNKLQERLVKTGIDSVVLTYGNHLFELNKFFSMRRNIVRN